MQHHHCPAPGCSAPSSAFSPLCATHQRTQARHGHYAQTALLLQQAPSPIASIRKRRKANPSSPAWALLGSRWSAIVSSAERVLADYEAGKVTRKADRLAAEQVRTVSRRDPGGHLPELVLAALVFARKQPHRFKSDRAIDFQLVRRVRGLAPVNAGSYWNQKERRVKRVYRDPCPQAVETLAQWLGLPSVLLQSARGPTGARRGRPRGSRTRRAGTAVARHRGHELNLTICSTAIRADDAGQYNLNDLRQAGGTAPGALEVVEKPTSTPTPCGSARSSTSRSSGPTTGWSRPRASRLRSSAWRCG
ncbi:MAG: hypothetical protein MZW92_26025 [Comamonadaceae bacterium]|nr:hypothetical protein [Comamonadaceae bacterium]